MTPFYILLCRNGDLINALPILKADADAGNRPSIMVHKDYLPLMSGISYADVIPFEGHMHDLGSAFVQAQKISADVRSLQVIADTETVRTVTYAPAGQTQALTDSFAKEPYKLLDRMDLIKAQPRPVFDRRDPAREKKLLKQLRSNPKNTILVATGGVTSPFPYRDLLLYLLRAHFVPVHAVCDISKLHTDFLYDFLALFEQAKCLVACDSALLHLANAVPTLPVVALVQDKPSLWHGSPWRLNHICHIRYSDFALRGVQLLKAIDGIDKPGSYFYEGDLNGPRIIHAWSAYELNDINLPRHKEARKTWQREYNQEVWVETASEVGSIGRDSRHSAIKDSGRFPFLKDVLRLAAYRSKSDADIICLTRCDTFFSDDLTQRLAQSKLPCWSHRLWRNGCGDLFHPHVDLFAFTVGWWKEHHKECPDLIHGRDPYWNKTLYDICRRNGGVELKASCFTPKYEVIKSTKPAERERYNESLLVEYEKKQGPVILFPKCTEQLPGVMINRHALAPFGYNPALVRWNNRWLMAYRYHDQGDLSTALGLAELDESFNVKTNHRLKIEHKGGSEEDCKFLIDNQNQLFLSYVDSTYPALPPRAVVRYGQLVDGSLVNVKQPKIGKNDGSACEKNWIFFNHNGRLMVIYESYPEQIIYEVNGDHEHRSRGLNWAYGEPRGGTAPIPFRDKLLRFFHSRLDNESGQFRRRYYCGAMLLDPEPPFKPVAISKEPLLIGSEADDLTAQEKASCVQYKAKVVFPGSAVESSPGGFIWLACGINDASCVIMKIDPEGLKL